MRNITALCVLGIGALILVAGRILMICAGFRTGAMWGICLLVGGFLVDVMYCISHWETARRPVYIQLVALGVLAAGWALSLF